MYLQEIGWRRELDRCGTR